MDARTASRRATIVMPEPAPTIRMTHSAGEATAGDHPVLHAAVGLAGQIRAASDEIERGRRIPPSIVAAAKDAGVFGMAMPRVWGGPELDPLTQFRVIETLAMADGSVGWCAMIGCDGGYVSLSRSGRRPHDVSRHPGSHRRRCDDDTARDPVPGGYRVSGRFPFVSGCQHCEWLWLGRKWLPTDRWQRRTGNSAVFSAVLTMRNPGHLAHHRAPRHREQ